ncbi:MAG: xanthine dehydrogenase molybdopterin binding subunit [Cocleimonas sp.]
MNERQSVGKSNKHDSADLHVSGEARYVDDIHLPEDTLHVAIGYSTIACGEILSIDLQSCKKGGGAIDVITASDIPGKQDVAPVFSGDLLLTDKRIDYHGQPIFAVVAKDYMTAKRAVSFAQIEYKEETPLLDLDEALEKEIYVRPAHGMRCGDAQKAIDSAPHKISGSLEIGGQDHLYLEGQISLAIPEEDNRITIHSSNQNPTETQHLVAEVLNLSMADVNVVTRRMGGAFGGKETQAAPWASIAAIFAIRNQRAVKCRLGREDDMRMTGKRHPFKHEYKVGFDEQGKILGVDYKIAADCGHSADLSDAIVDRAMFHCDNTYHLKNANIIGLRAKTNTVSHTAFRGFGGPQGMMLAEVVIEDIARYLGKDALAIRRVNFYKSGDKTPYGQSIDSEQHADIVNALAEQSKYQSRRKEIEQFNQHSPIIKRGISLTPVKFGISFTVASMNQAGALIHIYHDGSIHLNHGGTEMGQGLMIKLAQIVAEEFQVDLDNIKINATQTDKVPNTSPTAASSGTDINGMAVLNAAQKLKKRLLNFITAEYECDKGEIVFRKNKIIIANKNNSFKDVIKQAYLARVSLSATGFYKTPQIHYDRVKAQGQPFFYYANGAAVSEVEVDTLSGESKVLRTDILHDVGDSINPVIDIGQIEGGYIQGMGWLTSEDLKWDQKGRLSSANPATYKIPTAHDVPEIFNVELLQNAPNITNTIFRSKAVGEPPLMLAISVWCAIRQVIASLADSKEAIELEAPATPENIMASIERLKK